MSYLEITEFRSFDRFSSDATKEIETENNSKIPECNDQKRSKR